MRIWIMDKEQTPQRFPLQRLFHKVVKTTGTCSDVCNILRARGYGSRINQLEEELDSAELVCVSTSELDTLSAGTEEWFYDLEAEVPGTNIRFGLHDSTELFLVGDEPVAEAVAEVFSDLRHAT